MRQLISSFSWLWSHNKKQYILLTVHDSYSVTAGRDPKIHTNTHVKLIPESFEILNAL